MRALIWYITFTCRETNATNDRARHWCWMHYISHFFAFNVTQQSIMEAKTTEHDETVVYSEEWLSSLPKAKGVTEDYTYQYQGFWFGTISLQGLIDCQQHFRPRENDVFLVTAPKSGTTWMKAPFSMLYFTARNIILKMLITPCEKFSSPACPFYRINQAVRIWLLILRQH